MDLWSSFFDILRSAKKTPLLQAVNFAREMEISRGMAQTSLQDPLRFRARFLALEVAQALVDDQANLRLDLAQSLLQEIQNKKYLIGPSLENEVFLFDHLQFCLQTLVENEPFRKLLQRLSPPLCHKGADRLIQDTLWPQTSKEIRSSDIKRAVLAAWMTWLRQTTGSCFATAPAILIQQEQPLRFLQDIFDLLTRGTLRRIVEGREYAVPLCPSMERADLMRPIASLSPETLAFSPGLLAAFSAAGFFPQALPLPERRRMLRDWIEKEEEAKTAKELIESVLLRRLSLEWRDIKEEEGLKRLEMNPLLAKQSAVYYQRPSERAKKVSEWKEKTTLACTAYQALSDCALLRAWEATVASFSDVKVDIGRWNLYTSLGMHPDHPGGVGAFLYQRIDKRLQKANREINALQSEYNQAVQTAGKAERMGLTAEWTRAMYTANAISQQLAELAKETEKLANLLSQMINAYDRLIPESFQEIFDPSLAQNLSEMIDDSPAGFRLAYKHGRSASSQWTFIRSSEEFIRFLREFLEYAEREMPEGMKWVEELSTELIQFIQTEEFLQGAIERAKANPTMQGKMAKPWEYISGGTMPGLLQTYYNRSGPFTILERKVQDERELLAFIIENIQQSAASKRILMHSPTHAFILRSDWVPADPIASVERMNRFWNRVPLQGEEWLAEAFALWLPPQERALFLHCWRQKEFSGDLTAFRQHLINCANQPALVDAFLYESLPLMNGKTALSTAAELSELDQSRLHPYFADSPYFTPVDFRERLKAAIMARSTSPFSKVDLDANIAAVLRERNFASPQPILFADTNWSAGFFGLTVSPQKNFELWRFNRTGMSGMPMNQWFNLQRNGSWIALCRHQEYT